MAEFLPTAYAAHSGILIIDNLKDFAGQDAETYRTSRVQSLDGKTRKLYCVIRARGTIGGAIAFSVYSGVALVTDVGLGAAEGLGGLLVSRLETEEAFLDCGEA